MTYKVEKLSLDTVQWFVEVAGVNMLTNELKRPELVNIRNMYGLADRMIYAGSGFVVKKDDILVGALGAMVVPNIYNPEFTTLAELFWYVLPEYRNTRAGLMLLNEFDKFGEEVADDSTMSLLPSSEVRSLDHRGFKLCEYGFRKEYTWQL